MTINHANRPTGNFYIRKGAKRSAARMRAVLEYKIEKEWAAIKRAERSIFYLNGQLDNLNAGKPLEEIYL